jgi:hypothetical protein
VCGVLERDHTRDGGPEMGQDLVMYQISCDSRAAELRENGQIDLASDYTAEADRARSAFFSRQMG